jgi:hypothetical protein
MRAPRCQGEARATFALVRTTTKDTKGAKSEGQAAHPVLKELDVEVYEKAEAALR